MNCTHIFARLYLRAVERGEYTRCARIWDVLNVREGLKDDIQAHSPGHLVIQLREKFTLISVYIECGVPGAVHLDLS